MFRDWALGREAHALLAAKSRGPEATAPVPQEKKDFTSPISKTRFEVM